MRSWVVVLVSCACSASAPEVTPDANDPDGADGPPASPTAVELAEAIASCDEIVGGPYAPGSSQPADIPICGLPNAVFWKADMDIDCDGKLTVQCNSTTDPYYMDQTAAVDSNGDPLDAAALPFVVIPGRSMLFDYRDAGLAMGSVVVVLYDGKLEYGVLGDVGPTAIIGEASYRMAEVLGIDPHPSTGGIESGVSYIAFTGADAKVDVIEDHAMAVELGTRKALELLGR